MPDQKWFDEQPIEKLEAIAVGNLEPPLKAMATIAIQKLKDKKLKEDADRKEGVHQKESDASLRELQKLESHKIEREDSRFQIQMDMTRRQNWWTRIIAIAALVVSVLGFLAGIWMHLHPIASAQSATSIRSSSSQPPIQTTPKP
jgi:hypothetical protein